MDDISTRLQRCFASVFPELTPNQILQASTSTVSKWDSLASITLISLVCEEFGVELNMDDFERFTSYKSLMDYLSKKNELSA
jgi:acyl carrier protein